MSERVAGPPERGVEEDGPPGRGLVRYAAWARRVALVHGGGLHGRLELAGGGGVRRRERAAARMMERLGRIMGWAPLGGEGVPAYMAGLMWRMRGLSDARSGGRGAELNWHGACAPPLAAFPRLPRHAHLASSIASRWRCGQAPLAQMATPHNQQRPPLALNLGAFQFSYRSGYFDWRLLHGIDVDSVVRL
jgi:hypothetical protein